MHILPASISHVLAGRCLFSPTIRLNDVSRPKYVAPREITREKAKNWLQWGSRFCTFPKKKERKKTFWFVCESLSRIGYSLRSVSFISLPIFSRALRFWLHECAPKFYKCTAFRRTGVIGDRIVKSAHHRKCVATLTTGTQTISRDISICNLFSQTFTCHF